LSGGVRVGGLDYKVNPSGIVEPDAEHGQYVYSVKIEDKQKVFDYQIMAAYVQMPKLEKTGDGKYTYNNNELEFSYRLVTPDVVYVPATLENTNRILYNIIYW